MGQLSIWNSIEREMTLPHILVDKPNLPEICMWRALSFILTKDHYNQPDQYKYNIPLHELTPSGDLPPSHRKREAERLSNLIQQLVKHEGNSVNLNHEQAMQYLGDDYAGGVAIFERSGTSPDGNDVLLVITRTFKQILSYPEIGYIQGDYQECKNFRHTKSFGWYWRTIFQVLRLKIREETILLDDLHDLFKSSAAYRKNFAHFRVNVLEAIDQDLQPTRAAFTYELIKQGRKVVAIKFYYVHAPLFIESGKEGENDLIYLDKSGDLTKEEAFRLLQGMLTRIKVSINHGGLNAIHKHVVENPVTWRVVLMRIALAIRDLQDPANFKRINNPAGLIVTMAMKSNLDLEIEEYLKKGISTDDIINNDTKKGRINCKFIEPQPTQETIKRLSVRNVLEQQLADFYFGGAVAYRLELAYLNEMAEADYIVDAVKLWVEDARKRDLDVQSQEVVHECLERVRSNYYLEYLNTTRLVPYRGFK
ncbi:replication initiation protein [Cesiribacter sp. SM1]|uniref:replication initiation protein n=1 Tax=Cesiribacter sp. SM1 TaxID=2861196 RepID=UPI001CD3FAF8|nr:replication initiation protein [Cesiribacter sp. SM1]